VIRAQDESEGDRSKQWGRDILAALALAFAGASITGYRFGRDDQIQYLAHLTALRDPTPFTSDPYTESFGSLGSVFWKPFALLSTPALDPWVMLIATLLIGACSALVLIKLARTMGAPGATAYVLPALLITPKEENYFGLVTLIDVELTATFAVLPLCLGALSAWTTRRVWLALILSALVVPLHPQTGAALLALWCASTALEHHPRRWFAVALGFIGLAGAWTVRNFAPVSPDQLDTYESLGRALYAPLIDLWSVPWRSWAALALLLIMGVSSIPRVLARANVLQSHQSDARSRLTLLLIASLVYPTLGGLLLALDPSEPLLWRLMIPRSLMFTQLIALIFAGLWIADRFTMGRTKVGSLVLLSIGCWPLTPLTPLTHIASGLLALLVVITIALESKRSRYISTPDSGPLPVLLTWTTLALIALVGFLTRPYPWTKPHQPDDWLALQQWAREHTQPDDLFITPPYLAGWRVGSHRATYAELRDGGLLFYAGDPVIEWWNRMSLLGMHNPRRWALRAEHATDWALGQHMIREYHDALEDRATPILRASQAHYIIVDPDLAQSIPGEPVFTSGRYQIRSINRADN